MVTKIVNVVNKSNHRLPEYETPWSSGMDLKANIDSPISIDTFERVLIPTGIYVSLPPEFEIQIRPRSGLALKRGITVLNTPGTIDADYRGEIGVVLINLSKEKFVINPGDRIAQMVVTRCEHVTWNEVATLDDTERGAGGFGHTGIPTVETITGYQE